MPFPITARSAGIVLLIALSSCRGGDSADSTSPEIETNQTGSDAMGRVDLRIRTTANDTHRFAVELAVDDQAQQHGLMGRTALNGNEGMLFPFPYPETASFWMKDTPLPLDLLFIRPDGTIAAVLEGKPNDLRPISAGEPVTAVLEIARGRAQGLGIAPGDRVDGVIARTHRPLPEHGGPIVLPRAGAMNHHTAISAVANRR